MFTRAARGHATSVARYQHRKVYGLSSGKVRRRRRTPTQCRGRRRERPGEITLDRMKRFETTSLASRTFEAFFLLLARTWHLSPILRALT
jgi:hypothetical protein